MDPSPETWQTRVDFLRAFLGGACRPGLLGEDVVQGTLLAAIERPPADDGALHGWLVAVARRQLQRADRDDARRAARERTSARSESALPSTAEVVAELEMRRRIEGVVEALPAHYRDAIRERFWEGLPPREIAARRGLRLATVKTHLRRALERLREALEGLAPDRPLEEAAMTKKPVKSLERPRAPTGWILAGSHPAEYETAVDRQARPGRTAGTLRFVGKHPSGFGTLMQTFRADTYRGKRLRFSGEVRTEEVLNWAGLWLRIDGPEAEGPRLLAFDNMMNRPIKGTTPWTRHELVLDVSPIAEAIAFGVLQEGPGQTWIDALRLEEVGRDVPVTALDQGGLPAAPVNLAFDA